MKHTWVIAGVLLTALALFGCKKETPADTAAPAAPAAEVAPATDPALAAAATPTDFDYRTFAGTFSGTLPCADCSGIDTTIVLIGDGTYTLDEIYKDKQDGNFKGGGTWTAEDSGTRLRLDPNSKSDEDRLFEVVGKNEIRALGKDGTSAASALNYSLKRAPAAQ